MSEDVGGISATMFKNQAEAIALVEKLFDVAQPSAIFAEPVTVGEHTVITASEVKVGMGFVLDTRGGPGAEAAESEGESREEMGTGFGPGGGGGGVSSGRPVAAITVGPEGLQIQPVVDLTTIALAAFTALGAMFMAANRMRAASRKLGGG